MKGYKYIKDNQNLLNPLYHKPISNETSIILSRAWSQNQYMYPILDSFNHNYNGNLIELTPLFIRLNASVSYKKGEQIYLDYGNTPVLSKYLNYGFIENKRPNCNDIRHLRNIGTEVQRVACISSSYSTLEHMIKEMSESLKQNDTVTIKGAAQYIDIQTTTTHYKTILFIGDSIERYMIDLILKNNTLQCYINTDKIKHCQLFNQNTLVFLFYKHEHDNSNSFNNNPRNEDFITTLRLLVRDLKVDSVWLGLNFISLKPLYKHESETLIATEATILASFKSYFLRLMNQIEQIVVAQSYGWVFWYGNNVLVQQLNQVGKKLAHNRSWVLVEVSGENAPTKTIFVELLNSIDPAILLNVQINALIPTGTYVADVVASPSASPISVSITGFGKFGKLICQPNEEPADVVEEFAYRAVAKGYNIEFEDMKQLMEYFCSRRKCKRFQITLPMKVNDE